MRAIILFTLAAALFAGGVDAKDMKACNADWRAAKGSTTLKHNAFISQCMKGQTDVAQTVTTKSPGQPAVTTTTTAPAAAPPSGAPVGATAQCKDGSYSMAKTHSGACSHHKGVAKFLK